MSIEALTVVLHHSRTQGAAKLVLIGIANHEGDGGSWPSIGTLAKYAGGVSRRTVQRAIQTLIEIGEITCIVNGARIDAPDFNKPNLYRITLCCPAECDGSTSHRRKQGGDISVTRGGDMSVTRGATPVSPKPSIEPSLRTNTSSNQFEGEFDKFWQEYPRKTDKHAARRAYLKAIGNDPDMVAVILAGAVALAGDPNLPPKAFIPYPATWLNAGGWENEPYPERPLTAEERELKEKRDREERWERERLRREADRLEREAEIERQRAIQEMPVERCEHDRIIYACQPCFKKRHADPGQDGNP
jgi:hypothetical protein